MTDWLDRRQATALLALVAALPLVWPGVPPLTDVLGHMGRYHILLHGAAAPMLAESFRTEWRLIGNLGADLLIVPLGTLFGVEIGTKLIALAIPALTVAGILTLGRAVHGRVPQTALFALPLAYAYPFQFGFLNFSLSVALALLLLALWIRLGQAGFERRRAWLFLALAPLLWLVHTVGWGLFGLAAAGSEFARRLDIGESFGKAVYRTGLACLPLATPVLLMLLTRTGSAEAETFDMFNWTAKLTWLLSVLRDRWATFDQASAVLLGLVVLGGLARRRVSPVLLLPALLCAAAFVLMPRVVTGSAYADMRLLPFTAILLLLAIRPFESSLGTAVAAAGLLFFTVRLTGTAASFALYDRDHRAELRALDHLPPGASVLSLVIRPCAGWATRRVDHLPALAIVRRDAFTNDQWTVDGAQSLEVIRPGVGRYDNDPSQLVYVPAGCRREGSRLPRAIAEFNRAAFDHVWLIGARADAPDLRPVWSNGGSTLYRVVR